MDNNLIRRTYNAFMDLRTGKADADATRVTLGKLRDEAGAEWEAIKVAALHFDHTHNH